MQAPEVRADQRAKLPLVIARRAEIDLGERHGLVSATYRVFYS